MPTAQAPKGFRPSKKKKKTELAILYTAAFATPFLFSSLEDFETYVKVRGERVGIQIPVNFQFKFILKLLTTPSACGVSLQLWEVPLTLSTANAVATASIKMHKK